MHHATTCGVGHWSLPQHCCEDIGPDNPSARRVEVPGGLHGRDFRIMVIESSLLWCQHTWTDEHHQGILHEILVGEQWLKETSRPYSGFSERDIVPVGNHARSDEHSLREFVVLQLFTEEGGALDLRETIEVRDTELYKIAGLDHVLVLESPTMKED